jgi:hypothetical protein
VALWWRGFSCLWLETRVTLPHDGASIFVEVPAPPRAAGTGQHETVGAPIWKYRMIICHRRDPRPRGSLK